MRQFNLHRCYGSQRRRRSVSDVRCPDMRHQPSAWSHRPSQENTGQVSNIIIGRAATCHYSFFIVNVDRLSGCQTNAPEPDSLNKYAGVLVRDASISPSWEYYERRWWQDRFSLTSSLLCTAVGTERRHPHTHAWYSLIIRWWSRTVSRDLCTWL